MEDGARKGPRGATAARGLGLAVGFVVAIDLVRWWRPAVLFEPDSTWWRLWLLLWAGTILAVAAAGWIAVRLFRLFERSGLATLPLRPLPLATGLVLAAALAAGIGLRFAALADPPPLFADEASLISPTLDLHGSLEDLRRPLRAVPYGIPRPFGTVGVFYLELFRLPLTIFGTTPLGIRFLSALGGAVSLLTGVLLARAVLPRGGATLAALALAGLRWHLVMSHWGWNAVVVIPFVDLATLLLLRGRTRGNRVATAAAGVVLGLGAHVYLSAWVGLAALVLFRMWPLDDGEHVQSRAASTLLFCGGFAVTVLPLFALGGPPDPPYFARVHSHNLLREIRIHRSPMPLFGATADGLKAPWLVPEPTAWADLPGRSRLGWILGIAAVLAFGRSLSRPRDLLSALLLSHAAAALAAAVVQGESGHPNGYRFVYLTSVTAVAVAAGALALIGVVAARHRRAAALAAIGLLTFCGLRGAVDAGVIWPAARSTFDAFRGHEALVGEAALRWRRFGSTSVDAFGETTVVRSILANPQFLCPRPDPAAAFAGRVFRVSVPGDPGRPGERRVERVRDPWGRDWATVWGRLNR